MAKHTVATIDAPAPFVSVNGAIGLSANRPAPGYSPREIAEYIHDLSGQLSDMADRAEFQLLAYLLEMVQSEAADILDRIPPDGLPTDRYRGDHGS